MLFIRVVLPLVILASLAIYTHFSVKNTQANGKEQGTNYVAVGSLCGLVLGLAIGEGYMALGISLGLVFGILYDRLAKVK